PPGIQSQAEIRDPVGLKNPPNIQTPPPSQAQVNIQTPPGIQSQAQVNIQTPAGIQTAAGSLAQADIQTEAGRIELFMSLFTGRVDVFAKRWENPQKGLSGYGPVCLNQWSAACPKKGGGKMKCGECPNKNFAKFDAGWVEKHLRGNLTIGVYPTLLDETCRFLAFDLDAKECGPDDLLQDVKAIRETCDEYGISMAVERSRSGQGVHFWIFFAENLTAVTARKFGSALITRAMEKSHKLSFETYDRMIPAQDTLPEGGFGNLIALPLQNKPRQSGNSVFVDENFKAYPDQWNHLRNVKKYTFKEIEALIRRLAPGGELGGLFSVKDDEGRLNGQAASGGAVNHRGLGKAEKPLGRLFPSGPGVINLGLGQAEKPWAAKKTEPKLSRWDFPEEVKIVRSNSLFLEKEGFSSRALNVLKRLAAFQNPEFYLAQAKRLSTFNIPRIISCSEETEKYLCLPRGLEDEVNEILENNSVDFQLVDETNLGRDIDVTFNGELRFEQHMAAESLLGRNNGVLSAATAFGKTVIGAYLIAKRKVNALVLVHRATLMAQWKERLKEFLTIRDEPKTSFTPTGRPRKKSAIGQIGGGKHDSGGLVDVAMMQSLISRDKVKEQLINDYGLVIVDECHHVSAVTFELILKNVKAKYVYGLTATPTRKDGHHPIIYMRCGKIIYRVDAKKQAAARPFDHYVIPRFTRFQKPAHRGKGDWEMPAIYGDIQKDELRNDLIIEDVLSAVKEGRNPIVLTERREHVNYLASMIGQSVKNVVVLMGGGPKKKKLEILRALPDIPEGEPFVIVATGKYAGEGFDFPRLDTLFLAMPISWKGTLQQYAGRLHRLSHGKKEVRVYDYVDVNVAMLERMYQNRLKGYASIGYKTKGTPQPLEEAQAIFHGDNFFSVYRDDLLAARKEILIVSPFLDKNQVLSTLSSLAEAKASVTVITKPPESYPEKERPEIRACLELLTNQGLTVKTDDLVQPRFTVLDARLVWYGSVSPLSKGDPEGSVMRFENMAIAKELISHV
ncbi:MAG: DEAD/DEAH box helicase family protein, partial [Deltaproteobacteria bacterium]|nr:DEAD/DEAH box helicase family protein [Deltaproteobacteria bacterium]